LGCWISPWYGPFSLGAHFETYEPFISLIFKFFLGHGKPWITENAVTESMDTVHTCILLILINIVELGKLTKHE
jgi:hypothetical protein